MVLENAISNVIITDSPLQQLTFIDFEKWINNMLIDNLQFPAVICNTKNSSQTTTPRTQQTNYELLIVDISNELNHTDKTIINQTRNYLAEILSNLLKPSVCAQTLAVNNINIRNEFYNDNSFNILLSGIVVTLTIKETITDNLSC